MFAISTRRKFCLLVTCSNFHYHHHFSTYAFATFDDLQQAQMAIQNLDQSMMKNRRLTVAMANCESVGSKATSPDVSFNTAPLARITCTVGGN